MSRNSIEIQFSFSSPHFARLRSQLLNQVDLFFSIRLQVKYPFFLTINITVNFESKKKLDDRITVEINREVARSNFRKQEIDPCPLLDTSWGIIFEQESVINRIGSFHYRVHSRWKQRIHRPNRFTLTKRFRSIVSPICNRILN